MADALNRARTVSPQVLTAANAVALAHEDRNQAKALLLPTLSAVSGYVFTQDNGTPEGVFVSNNGVHVYDEQANVHAELLNYSRLADLRRSAAAEAVALARQDVARRGLAVVTVQNYYAVLAAQRRITNATRSLDEARRFEDLTHRQEQGGEVARADVVKAQLQTRQRQRDLVEAQTNVDKAKLALAVLIFQNLDQPFTVVDDLSADLPLQPTPEIRQQAFAGNPDLRSAELTVDQARFAHRSAVAGYYPTLTVDYFYGIDANVFGIHGPFGRQNLGSVVAASVNVPVWNWGATRSRVRQSEVQQRQAEIDLNYTRRQIDAAATGFYLEAQVARAQLELLKSSLDLAEESLRLTTIRYQAGEATALEVVDAQNTALGERNGYDDGLVRYRLALANIETLTGKF